VDEAVSPTVARRQLRLAVRAARAVAIHTQLEVADEMEWSLTKVIRIESGDVGIAPNDLRPLLAFLRMEDRAKFAGLGQGVFMPGSLQTPEHASNFDEREALIGARSTS
jgi:hypothetical protein